MRPSAAVAQQGFTLVELLLAITLMSLLLALAYGGLSAASRSSAARPGYAGTIQPPAHYPPVYPPPAEPHVAPELCRAGRRAAPSASCSRAARGIQFVARCRVTWATAGRRCSCWKLPDGPEGLRLQFRHALLQGFARELLQERDPVVLLDGLAGCQFEFLEGDGEGLPPGWVADWATPEHLPLAVRLQLEMPEGAAVHLAGADRVCPPGCHCHQCHWCCSDSYSDTINDMIRRSGNDNQLNRQRQQGIALVLVLWVLILLTVTTGSYALMARMDQLEANQLLSGTQARLWAEAGLNLAARGTAGAAGRIAAWWLMAAPTQQ